MSSQYGSPNSPQSSFPPSDHPILAELTDPPRRRWVGVLAGLLVSGVIVALVVGPLLYFAWPGELARWRIAAAEQKRLKGDLQGAIQELDRALAQNPNDTQLLRHRAKWRIEQKEYVGALEDYNRVVDLSPGTWRALQERAEALQYLGRHKDAIADWKQILKHKDMERADFHAIALNGLAYARALGDVEIDEALVDIDEALRIVGEEYSLVDTRGYLYYRKGDLDRALTDLDQAVTRADEEYGPGPLPHSGLGGPDPLGSEVDDTARARVVAVIRYHRALVHDKRGDTAKGDEDRQRIRQLGFEPGDTLF